jgi:hypothetical protein
MNYPRILAFSLLVLLALLLPGLTLAMMLGWRPFLFGHTSEAAGASFRLIEHVATGDVPPLLSSTAVWSPIPHPKEIGREEALFRRTDHRLPA